MKNPREDDKRQERLPLEEYDCFTRIIQMETANFNYINVERSTQKKKGRDRDREREEKGWMFQSSKKRMILRQWMSRRLARAKAEIAVATAKRKWPGIWGKG